MISEVPTIAIDLVEIEESKAKLCDLILPLASSFLLEIDASPVLPGHKGFFL